MEANNTKRKKGHDNTLPFQAAVGWSLITGILHEIQVCFSFKYYLTHQNVNYFSSVQVLRIMWEQVMKYFCSTNHLSDDCKFHFTKKFSPASKHDYECDMIYLDLAFRFLH